MRLSLCTHTLGRLIAAVLGLSLGALPVACEGRNTHGTVLTVTVTPTQPALTVGDSVALRSSSGGRSPCACLWESSAPAVATVSPAALVRGVSPGLAIVTATASADPNAKRSVVVEVRAR
jgi:uncharacterized protein YjdB